jgi:hypothetical protein
MEDNNTEFTKKEMRRVFLALWILAFLMAVGIVGQYYMTTLTAEDLRSRSGVVLSLEEKPTGFHGLRRQIIIVLDNRDDEFYFEDDQHDYFDKIKAIKKGDEVTILFRTWFQSFIGMGRQYEIKQIESNGLIVYSLENTKEQHVEGGKFTACILFALLALIWFAVRNLKES